MTSEPKASTYHAGSTWRNFAAGKERRAKFMEAFVANSCNVDMGLAAAGVARSTYHRWRQVFPDFAAQCDSERARLMDVPQKGTKWDKGFAAFRKTYFGMDSPWFHLDVVRVLDRVGGPGEVVMVLLPPEHGKTTLLEDYLNFKLALDPSFRITYGSANQSHSRKVGGRVKNRMQADGPSRQYVYRFGPFEPQTNTKRTSVQPWGADYWNVYKKGEADERDYSFVALGMGSEIIGSRTDLLVADDPQSRKTLGQSKQLVERFRQDWLSRPGTKGRTVIIGSRVGVDDFYALLIEEGIVDHLIRYPAIDDDGKYLWPERYSEQEYKIMERNAGPEGWARNYLMRPSSREDQSFTDEHIEPARNPYRSVNHGHQDGWPRNAMIGWDPGYGTNAVCSAAVSEDKFWVLHQRTDVGLTSPQQLFAVLEEELIRTEALGYKVVEVVVEDKAFQHGLLQDEQMNELVRVYGFRVHGHQTGGEKNDEDIGVPGMVLSLLRLEMQFPDADEESKRNMTPLYDELKAWRPFVRGNRQRMDRVMAMWFIWLRWRRKKHALAAGAGVGPPLPVRNGLPWKPTNVPMLARRP